MSHSLEGTYSQSLGNLCDGVAGSMNSGRGSMKLMKRVKDMCSVSRLFQKAKDGVKRRLNQVAGLHDRSAALMANCEEMCDLAEILEEGSEEVERDVGRAVELYERAITKSGNVRAMTNLGNLLREGAEGVEKNVRRAVGLYERAVAEGGYIPAMNNLGFLLSKGAEGLEKNMDRAARLYERAIAEGADVFAMNNLGLFLEKGAGDVEKNVSRAVELYERAIAEGGHVPAMNNLGVLLSKGVEGVEKNVSRAVELYERAITEVADVYAMTNLGVLLEEGAEGVEKNANRAVRLYERAITEGGHVPAMNKLGRLLSKGAEGVEKNMRKAVELYERAIMECGSNGAMGNLALLLRSGDDGLPRDVQRAISLFEQAIDIANKAIHKYELALTLLSADIEHLRDPPRAKRLLEQVVQDSKFGPAIYSLAMLLKKGDKGVEQDAGRASHLIQRLLTEVSWEYPNYTFKPWNDVERGAKERTELLVESILKNKMVKPRCCFLLTLGGAGRGKTSVVRSLRRADFVEDHKETALYDLNRFMVTPGDESFDGSALTQVIQDSESLFAPLTRLGSSYDILESVETYQPTVEERIDEEMQVEVQVEVDSSGDTPANNAGSGAEDGNGGGGLLKRSIYEHSSSGPLERIVRCDGGAPGENSLQVPANNSSFSPCLRTGPSSKSLREKVRALRETIRQQAIFNTRNALATGSFPEARECALVQCWDAGGQQPYMMAHPLFIRRASILMFVINLKNMGSITKRYEEVRVLCEWMELAHALVTDPGKVRVVIVGTRKGSCGDEKAVWRFLEERLVEELGEACYNAWVRANEENKGAVFVGIENRDALNDPEGSGRRELERVVKKITESIVEEREPVAAKSMALIEEMEKIDEIFVTNEEVEELVDGFPGFEGSKKQKCEDAMEAFRYFGNTGRLVLLEEEGGRYFVFMNPEKIVDFVRMVTGPEKTIRSRLKKSGAQLLSKGLLPRDGLNILWHKYTSEEREVLLKLLCRFDLLMRIPNVLRESEHGDEMIAIPALLPMNGVRWAGRNAKTELMMKTEFVDAFPMGIMSIVIAHLHRTVGGERTGTAFVRSVAILLSVNGPSDDENRNVMVEFDKTHRRIVWTVRATKGMVITYMQRCLKAFEECLEDPLWQMRIRRKHFLTSDCEQELSGCGKKKSVEFELRHEWIMSETTNELPNLEGRCSCGIRCHLKDWHDHFVADQSAVESVTSSPPLTSGDVVFISHAGEQKRAVAHPLRESLEDAGFHSFLDVKDLHAQPETVREQLIAALGGCNVAVFVLSPEFVAKKWPMKELREMQRLKRKAREDGRPESTLFPLFFALTVEECKNAELLFEKHGEIFERKGFFEESRQQSCSTKETIAAVRELAEHSGIVHRTGEGETVQEFVQRAALKLCGSSRRGLLSGRPTAAIETN